MWFLPLLYVHCYDPCLLLCMIMADVYSVNYVNMLLCTLVSISVDTIKCLLSCVHANCQYLHVHPFLVFVSFHSCPFSYLLSLDWRTDLICFGWERFLRQVSTKGSFETSLFKTKKHLSFFLLNSLLYLHLPFFLSQKAE